MWGESEAVHYLYGANGKSRTQQKGSSFSSISEWMASSEVLFVKVTALVHAFEKKKIQWYFYVSEWSWKQMKENSKAVEIGWQGVTSL